MTRETLVQTISAMVDVEDVSSSGCRECLADLPPRHKVPPFKYEPMVQPHFNKVDVKYRKLPIDGVSSFDAHGREFVHVASETLTELTAVAYNEINFFLREAHLRQLISAYADPAASDNDRFVLSSLMQNAVVSSFQQLPLCQDTGTAIIHGHRGQNVLTDMNDGEALSRGVYEAYTRLNLRNSQNAPLDMFTEKNTGCNLPAQIDLHASDGAEEADKYEFLFVAKGGGSANKTTLYQKTKALLNPESLDAFVVEALRGLGTAACPPYHISLVIGGTSAEYNLSLGKLASCHDLDGLPTSGASTGRAYRDIDYESRVLDLAQKLGVGSQFGGKYFALDARVIRLPRHGASCPVSIAVSCSADRQIKAYIDRTGVYVEQLCHNPFDLIRSGLEFFNEPTVSVKERRVDLSNGIESTLCQLKGAEIGDRVLLTGPLVVARDIAHARLLEELKTTGKLPSMFRDCPIYYAGPARCPAGAPSGSLGPTTASRMDPYVPVFQAEGYSMVTLAKGNRQQMVADSCGQHGGYYLGSIGGPAALLAARNITSVRPVMYEELGMEAVWRLDVVDFPAIVLVNANGERLYKQFGL